MLCMKVQYPGTQVCCVVYEGTVPRNTGLLCCGLLAGDKE